MARWKILILGAAGRDFHNFNVAYRNDSDTEVAAFTATQIPGIANRRYPPELAGKLYPRGIPIEDEKNLEELISRKKINECVLSYSDISYNAVMHLASRVIAAGAKFSMLGWSQTALKSRKPVIAVVAVRTGCGKSPTSRCLMEILREAGKKVVLIRHPMPYGDLAKQKVQRYETPDDFKKHECTIEEVEEYEPHIAASGIVYAGVDYGLILRRAEKEADVIIWDGGNNDLPFYRPTFTITVADPHRPGHEVGYYPGEVNFRSADVILINKVDSADPQNINTVLQNARKYNPSARVIKAESVLQVDCPGAIAGKKVLVIEDGPTLTHGEMTLGAGVIAARRFGASDLVDPRPHAVGSIKDTFQQYPHIGALLPAMGYGSDQVNELGRTINAVSCDSVVIATPINLARFIKINKPFTRVHYGLSKKTKKELRRILKEKKLI